MNSEFKCYMFFKEFLESLPEGTQKFIICDWKDAEHGGCGMMMDNEDYSNSVAYLTIAYTSLGTFYCHKIISKDDQMRAQKIQNVIESLGAKKVNITKEMDKFVIQRPTED